MVDLAKSLVLAQEQCMAHAVDLIKNRKFLCENGNMGFNKFIYQERMINE